MFMLVIVVWAIRHCDTELKQEAMAILVSNYIFPIKGLLCVKCSNSISEHSPQIHNPFSFILLSCVSVFSAGAKHQRAFPSGGGLCGCHWPEDERHSRHV